MGGLPGVQLLRHWNRMLDTTIFEDFAVWD